MSFRALDSNGDWTIGNGLQNYLVEEAAISADINTALRVFLGECFFALEAGVDWWNLIGSKDEAGIILQCRQVIANRTGVVRINSVTTTLTRDRSLFVTYDVDTIFTRRIINTVTVL